MGNRKIFLNTIVLAVGTLAISGLLEQWHRMFWQDLSSLKIKYIYCLFQNDDSYSGGIPLSYILENLELWIIIRYWFCFMRRFVSNDNLILTDLWMEFRQLEEAMVIDGANIYQVFLDDFATVSSKGIISVSIFNFIYRYGITCCFLLFLFLIKIKVLFLWDLNTFWNTVQIIVQHGRNLSYNYSVIIAYIFFRKNREWLDERDC